MVDALLGEGPVREAYRNYIKARYASPNRNSLNYRLSLQARLACALDVEQKRYFSILCNEFDRNDKRATDDAERQGTYA